MTETKQKLDGEQEAEHRIAEALATQATELDLSGFALVDIPDTVFQLTRLR